VCVGKRWENLDVTYSDERPFVNKPLGMALAAAVLAVDRIPDLVDVWNLGRRGSEDDDTARC
jgi:hypothetical protein